MMVQLPIAFFFFFNDTAPPEIYPLPLHGALPISPLSTTARPATRRPVRTTLPAPHRPRPPSPPQRSPIQPRPIQPRPIRSEEHTSELQSQSNLVCRLLLEKKKKKLNPCLEPPSYT